MGSGVCVFECNLSVFVKDLIDSSQFSVALNDFFAFDPASMTWTRLDSKIKGPALGPAYGAGFVELKGKLYTHGGASFSGDVHCIEIGTVVIVFN